MKCLSLWQPWATLFTSGHKEFETRSWDTPHRGLLLIHAAKRWDKYTYAMCQEPPFCHAITDTPVFEKFRHKSFGMPLGYIIGVVELVSCHLICPRHLRFDRSVSQEDLPLPSGNERTFGNYHPGRFAWRAKNARLFAAPIPCCGRQTIFNVPDDLVAEQLQQARAA